MTMKYLRFFLISILFFSCKDEVKKPQGPIIKQVVKKNSTQDNMLEWESKWTLGVGSVDGFKSFGKEEESQRIKAENQDSKQAIIWECIPDKSTVWDGGFQTSKININSNKAYRYSVWVKKLHGRIGKIYTAVEGVTETTGQEVKNANFIAAGSVPTNLDDWYCLVGYIYPSNHKDDIEKDAISGLYHQGVKVQEGRDFKWKVGATKTSFRTLLNNCKDNTQERLYITSPSLYIIDGTEPKLSEIL